MAKRLKLDIVTIERIVFSGEVDIVTAPGVEGEMGILPRHASLLTALTYGELRVRRGETVETFAIGGGFMEVLPDQVTVLADSAERAEEIDLARAQAARQRAEERLRMAAAGQLDFLAAEAALRRSITRIKVAEHRRRRPEERQPGRPPESQ